MPSRIEDYALIGDCQTAALVARDGSIDWLCFPRFDSGACFAALLGTPEHGRWQIAPAGPVRRVRRHYWPGTLILETEYETDSGVVSVIDCMPPRDAAPDVMRLVVGRRGSVRMRMDLIIRFDYGSVVPWVQRSPTGLRATAGPDTLFLRTPVPVHGEDLRTVAEFTVTAGERVPFVLTWASTYAAVPDPIDPAQELDGTAEWWRAWSDRCTYEGAWREDVLRSLITLKALTYAPTGGLVAAATTSLPEQLGGVRNWDYRYCWLRDATFTLYALMTGGYLDEAQAWRNWLVNAVAGEPAKLQIMYGLAGERRLTELSLGWLPGYEGSAPVRIGNAAYDQHQLDIYGEVMDALHLARRAGLANSDEAWRVQRALMKFLETAWRKPDEGLWEIRGPRRHFTHSKVMAWVAMDRAVKAVECFGLPGDAATWRRLRDEIHAEVCTRGFDPGMNSFVQHYGSTELDASLLMLPLVGFLPATDPRMVGTVAAIQARLRCDGFVARYATSSGVDGLPPGEGAFLLCSFWLADNLALQGRVDEARELFERLLSLRNDVGLLSEEYDPLAKRLVGNFPQAFSHVGLINTARNLDHAGGPAEDRQHQSAGFASRA
ncbi:glycoside hydrolase family 15 protein [Polyangium aurulentum]|uniref:glycoside hydrolase family 15 protein n=1 Tax=Polyangium aurulentum TaxID=2567896 RepID=UPI0010AEC1AF|nr:glycoside hydrolase family 15 protein [Polyangium aurulentum]UQA56845.1 glycoside hydrolase family 15 protein [Polyangium aurulentum]